MRPLVPSLLLLALLPTAALGVACTDEQNEYSHGIYEAAALTVQCASVATVTSSSVSFSYKCSDTSCLPVLRQLEYQLPDCENASGVNLKYNLQQHLYVTCGLCDYGQYETVTDLYTAAAQSDACDEYSTITSSYILISWPCSATSCSAVIAAMAEELPSCIEDGENVQTYAKNLDCYSSNDVDDSDAPTGSASTGTTEDDDTPEPTTTEEDDTPEPTTTEEASESESSDASTPEPSYDDYTYTPVSTTDASYSSDSCSLSEVSDMVSLYYDTATSSACDSYSTITSYPTYYYIYIYTPCSSSCASSLRDLADDLPDCYYDYEFTNKKEELTRALTVCDSRRRLSIGRRDEEDASSDYISILMYGEGDSPSQAGVSSGSSEAVGDNSTPRSAGSLSPLAAVVAAAVAAFGLQQN